jgi:cytochrome c5
MVLALLLGACGPEEVGETDPDTDLDTDETDPACQDLSWATVGQPFVRTWCTGCHGPGLEPGERAGAPETVDLATHDDVLRHLDRVEARTVDGTPSPMPPGGGPGPVELERFAAWIGCGAP